MTDTAEHPRTHNNPPDPITERIATLEQTHADLLTRNAELLGMEERLPTKCDDDDWEAKLTNAIKQCTVYTKNSEATRLSANEPYRALIAATDGFFKKRSDDVDKLKKKMSVLLSDYQNEKADAERRRLEAIAAEERRVAAEAKKKADEEARIAREAREAEEARAEAARKAAAKLAGEKRAAAERAERERVEAAAARQKELDDAAAKSRDEARGAKQEATTAKIDAGAKSADLSRSRTSSGAVASLRVTWHGEVVDEKLVPREYLTVKQSAIDVAVKAATTPDNKNTLRIPGVRVYSKSGSVVR